MLQIQLLDTSVFIGDDSLPELLKQLTPHSRIFVLVDVNTLKKCLPVLENIIPDTIELHTLAISPGEMNKTLNTATLLWKQLLQLNVNRGDVLINLGGGVVSDIGAFVASTYKRGIGFINIPTTLLAMADASIGGKTAVDFEGAKNIIGTFAHPKSVFIYPSFLHTLETQHIKNGYAEIIKYALIYSNALWDQLQLISLREMPADKLIAEAVKIKVDIVKNDPLEKGTRKILNYGHTIGHALESWSLMNDRDPLLHGEAIAAGMICEAWLSNQKAGLSQKDLQVVCNFILKHYPKYVVPQSGYGKLMEFILHDKKNTEKHIQFSLLKSIGECKHNVSCKEHDIIAALNFYADLS